MQDAQERWPEGIDSSLHDIPDEGEAVPRQEEEITSICAVGTSVPYSRQPASRTVGQKRHPPPSSPEGPGERVPSNSPGPSGLNGRKRSKVSQPGGDYRKPCPTDSFRAVASVKPMSAGAQTESVSASGVPVVSNIQQAADIWSHNPLIRVKVATSIILCCCIT